MFHLACTTLARSALQIPLEFFPLQKPYDACYYQARYSREQRPDQKAPEVEAVILIAFGPLSARNDDSLWRDCAKHQPIQQEPVDEVKDEYHTKSVDKGVKK